MPNNNQKPLCPFRYDPDECNDCINCYYCGYIEDNADGHSEDDRRAPH